MRELIADGAIGEVRSVQADLGVQREFDPTDRLFALELGGGALLGGMTTPDAGYGYHGRHRY